MSENYGKYKNARNASWQVLIDYNINSLPIKVSYIAKQANIMILKNSKYKMLNKNQIGLSFKQNNKWYIIYDDSVSTERARFTVAHELGHIFLGHESLLSRNTIYEKEKPDEETEADIFASRLLSPACVLWGLDLHNAEEIAKACSISYTAASIRAERMKILYKRNKFLLSPLERRVYENFLPYIKNKKPLKTARRNDGIQI